MATDQILQTMNKLIAACIAGEREIYTASEHIKNRGLKVLVKRYAQYHTDFVTQLRQVVAQLGGNAPETDGSEGALRRGWHDIQAVMTVQLQSRQELVLEDAARVEQATLDAYEEAARMELPDEIRGLIQGQYERIHEMRDRLILLAGDTPQQVVVRLFQRSEDAERVEQGLYDAGFSPTQVVNIPLDESLKMSFADDKQRRRSLREMILTNVAAGFGLGAIAGLLLGIVGNFFFPDLPAVFAVTPTGKLIEAVLIAGLIGAFWGLVFGWLMGRSTVEEDADLYDESLQEGEALLLVITDAAHRERAEQIMGLIHEREVAPMAI